MNLKNWLGEGDPLPFDHLCYPSPKAIHRPDLNILIRKIKTHNTFSLYKEAILNRYLIKMDKFTCFLASLFLIPLVLSSCPPRYSNYTNNNKCYKSLLLNTIGMTQNKLVSTKVDIWLP